jgi:hypothetical protein
MSQASYAEIDYYTNKSLSAIAGKTSQPNLYAIINPSSSINYENGTWSSLSGEAFNFTAVIGYGAYTASAGTVVGTANSSTFAGTMQCEVSESRGSRAEGSDLLFRLFLH